MAHFETFEIELAVRDDAEVTAQDVLDILKCQTLDYNVRRVETGEALSADHDIAWGVS